MSRSEENYKSVNVNDSLFPVKINTFFELNLWVIDGFDGNQLMLQKLELNVKFGGYGSQGYYLSGSRRTQTILMTVNTSMPRNNKNTRGEHNCFSLFFTVPEMVCLRISSRHKN